MIPPEWVVSAIEDLDPNARLAWMGGDFCPDTQFADSAWPWLMAEAKAEKHDTVDVGQFYIVKLFHYRDAGTTMHTLWGNAGPVFGSRYDPLCRFPVIIMPVTKQSVFNGAAVRIARDMLKPWAEVCIESAIESDKKFKRQREDLAQEAGDRLWHDANRTDGTHTVLAKKFIDKNQKAVLAGDKPPSKLDTYHQDMLK